MTKGDEFIGGGWWRRDATGEEKKRKEKERKKEKKIAVGTTLARKFVGDARKSCLHAFFRSIISGDQRCHIVSNILYSSLLFC